MTKQVRLRRGSYTQHATFVGADGELTVDTTNKNLRLHDGILAGGHVISSKGLTSVKDFGAKGDGIADDTAAMVAAHATGKVIFYPAGTYRFTQLNFSSGGMIGEGRDQTKLLCTDTSSNNAITYTGSSSQLNPTLLFKDIGIYGPSASNATTKAGSAAGLLLTTSDSSEVSYFNMSNVIFAFWPRCLDIRKGAYWSITNCQFLAYSQVGLRIANEINADSGDATVMGCLFNTGNTAGNGILHRSSGGLKILGNKFLGGNNGYRLEFEATHPTGVLVFSGNSVENMTNQCMSFSRASGNEAFINISITGNEFAVSPTGIQTGAHTIWDLSNWMKEVTITGNVFNLLGTGFNYGINLATVTDFVISGNTFKGNGGSPAGILIDTTCTNGKIGINSYSTLTTAIVNNSTTTWVQYDPISGGGEGRTVAADTFVGINVSNLGLSDGDVVITKGQFTVADGMGAAWEYVSATNSFRLISRIFGNTPDDAPRHLDLGTAAYQNQTWLHFNATHDPASIANGAQVLFAMTCPGVELGDFIVGTSLSINAGGLQITGYVSAANTVQVLYSNTSGGAVDLASHTVWVRVMKRLPT